MLPVRAGLAITVDPPPDEFAAANGTKPDHIERLFEEG